MSAAARWEGTAIRYPFTDANAVGPVDVTLNKGERILLLGPSGSGKSSLMLALTGLIPQSIPAEVAGETRLAGMPTSSRSPAQWADTVAQYFQNADDSLCGMKVGEEVAFALENAGGGAEEIQRRVDAALEAVGLSPAWRDRHCLRLSGGERQLVALAAVVAQGAPILVADEPTAHLSSQATAAVHALLGEPDRFDSVLVIDHRLDGLVGAMDRVVVLGRDGRVIVEMPPAQLFRAFGPELDAAGIWRPAFSVLDEMLCGVGIGAPKAPLSFDDTLAHLGPEQCQGTQIEAAKVVIGRFVSRRVAGSVDKGAPVVTLENVACAPLGGKVVLEGINLTFHAGETVALVGPNGAGKTTLAAVLAGIVRPKKGRRSGPLGGMAFQNAEAQLFGASVRDEIQRVVGEGPDRGERVAATLERWDLTGLETRHPFELSHGQKRRLALATLDADDRWPLLVLDEPFAGLDAAGAEALARHIEALRAAGRAIVLITHDMDMALRLCSRSILVAEGSVRADGAAREILCDAALVGAFGLSRPYIATAIDWLESVGTGESLAEAG